MHFFKRKLKPPPTLPLSSSHSSLDGHSTSPSMPTPFLNTSASSSSLNMHHPSFNDPSLLMEDPNLPLKSLSSPLLATTPSILNNNTTITFNHPPSSPLLPSSSSSSSAAFHPRHQSPFTCIHAPSTLELSSLHPSPTTTTPHLLMQNLVPPPPPSSPLRHAHFTQSDETLATTTTSSSSSSTFHRSTPSTTFPLPPPSLNPSSATSSSSSSSSSSSQRRIYVNIPVMEQDVHVHFKNNAVRSTKYTVWTFFPKNLWEQFRHVANFYFLVIVILQFIPVLRIGNPFFGAVPFLFILSVSAFKDGIEDFRRYLEDHDLNNKCTLALSNWKNVNPVKEPFFQRFLSLGQSMWYRGKVYGSSFTCFKRRRPLTSMAPSLPTPSKSVPTTPTWAPKPWQSIRVGDMVYLQNNESIPADILILSTSEPDHVCYVETQSLDGETNLKIKKAPSTSSISPSFINPLTCSTFQAMIQVDAPVANLSQFHGVLFTSTSKTFLTMASLLLRGCTLRNTSWVIGIVMYTGEDTKLVLNSGSTPSKLTQIDARLNPHVIMNFLILFTMSVVSTVTHMIYISSFDFERAVFNSKTEPMGWISGSTLALTTFLLSLIVFQTLIPISLFVTTEVVKTIQAYFIHSDLQLYDVHRDVPCVVHAWTLADDLGQVEYIFSDKTGTLTKNEMVFHACSIRGTLYGVGLDHTLLMEHDLMQKRNEAFHQLLLSHTSLAFNYDLSKFPRNFNDLHLIPSLIQPHSDATLFFLALALCHTVLPEKVTHVDTQVTQMTYKAQSPDEAALVIAAHQVGITFLSRSKQSVCVDVLGQIMEFEVLEILEFDSNRKRMSVLLVHPHHSKILVVCKGADSVIFERLHSDQQTLGQTTLHHLLHFSNQGLRTLCLAYRYLEYPFFLNWHRQYQTIMTHLDHPNRQEMISHLINQVESEFTLLGATAIEDKLQDQVPETIQKLMAARLKIWVLTGDKLETAISIGFSCHLLQPSMTLIVIQGDAVDEIHKQLEEAFFMVLQLPQPCRHSHSHSQERSERRRRFRLRRRRCRHRHDSNTMPSLTSSSSNLSAQDEDHEVTPSLLHSSSSSSASLKEGEANIDLHLSTQVASLQPTQNDDVLVASLDVLDVKMDPNRLSITEPVLCDLKQVPSSFSSSSSSSSSSLSFKDRNRHSTAESSMPTMVNEKDMEDDLFENEILSSPTHLDDPSSSTHSTHSFALVLDGTALKHALGADLKLLFLEVACRCTAVMCCRVSPKQKADVVGLVKKELNCSTLSIGDGANDVNMLHEANIGVGIAGVEGCQAALASDFAVTQFQHLQRLIFVHGRWNYRRVGLMCLLFFYKNATFVLAMFWFQFYSGFSSSPLFEYSYITYYNAVFTVIPTFFFGIFDQDVNDTIALSCPQLYSEGPVHKFYNNFLFFMYFMDALYQSIIVYFFTFCIYDDSVVYPNGLSYGILEMGSVMAAKLILLTNLYTFFHFKLWTWLTFTVFFITFLIFPVYLMISCLIPESVLKDIPVLVLHMPLLWYSFPLTLSIALLPRVCFVYWRTHFPPYSLDHTLYVLRQHTLRPRSMSRTALMLESMVSSFQETMMTVMDFTKRGLRRTSKYGNTTTHGTGDDGLLGFHAPPSMLVYMGSGRSQPNTGFAFSADPGLSSSQFQSTRDVASDLNVMLHSSHRSSGALDSDSMHGGVIRRGRNDPLLHDAWNRRGHLKRSSQRKYSI